MKIAFLFALLQLLVIFSLVFQLNVKNNMLDLMTNFIFQLNQTNVIEYTMLFMLEDLATSSKISQNGLGLYLMY